MMRRWVVIAVVVAACKSEPASAPAAGSDRPRLSPVELKQAHDACNQYVLRVCDCMDDTIRAHCKDVRALPQAIDLAVQVAANPESTRLDVLQANDSVHKTVKTCIEETNKLATAKCGPN